MWMKLGLLLGALADRQEHAHAELFALLGAEHGDGQLRVALGDLLASGRAASAS
jgi:hypothetical protein